MTEHQRVIDAFSPAQLYAALLATYPQQVHAIERRDNLLFTLTDALLTHVLSFAWRDAARLARCSKRIHGLVQQRAFWEPAIRERMRVMLLTKRADLTIEEVEFFSTRWTPFDEWLLPRLCQRVGWLFPHTSKRVLTWRNKRDGDVANILQIRHVGGDFFIYWRCLRGVNCPVYFRAKFMDSVQECRRTKYYWFDGQMAGLLRTETYVAELPMVRLHDGVFVHDDDDDDDASLRLRWQGTSIRKTKTTPSATTVNNYTPHGAGRWTNYDTGELILEGDDVAFAGEIHDGVTWFAGRRVCEPKPKRAKTDE